VGGTGGEVAPRLVGDATDGGGFALIAFALVCVAIAEVHGPVVGVARIVLRCRPPFAEEADKIEFATIVVTVTARQGRKAKIISTVAIIIPTTYRFQLRTGIRPTKILATRGFGFIFFPCTSYRRSQVVPFHCRWQMKSRRTDRPRGIPIVQSAVFVAVGTIIIITPRVTRLRLIIKILSHPSLTAYHRRSVFLPVPTVGKYS